MIGKRLNFINRICFIILVCVLFSSFAYSQKGISYEEKAVIYFCNNIKQIKKGLIDYSIRFKWQTTGYPSRLYKIADCVGDISLKQDSIPNKVKFDKLEKLISYRTFDVINITKVEGCNFLKRHIFAPFNKQIYTLHVFNAVEYKGIYFVELYLVNKNMQIWEFLVKFNNRGEPVEHCISYFIY